MGWGSYARRAARWCCALALVPLASIAPAGSPAGAAASTVTPSATRAAGTARPSAMWAGATDGGVFTFGGRFFGSMGGTRLTQPVIAMAATPRGRGYWLAALDGGVFAFGDARFLGGMGGRHLDQPIVGMASTVTGRGYWLVAADGGVFAFGDARFLGSMGGRHLDQPIAAMARTATGRGYLLVARDGGVFTFGDARFSGSAANTREHQPYSTIATAPGGYGYWLLSRDGHVANFGGAGRYGDTGVSPAVAVAIVPTRSGRGYWTITSTDAVHAFGDAAPFATPTNLAAPIVGATTPWSSSSGYALVLLEALARLAAPPRTWPGPHEVALTFDDGPSAYTARVIAALASRDVHGTFFAVGYGIAARPADARAVVAAGNPLEVHTWDHADLTKLTPAAIDDELRRTADLIRTTTGEQPRCFRPPYGRTNPTVVTEGFRLGLAQVLWNVDPSDYLRPGSAAIAARVLATATGRGLVVAVHDGGGDRSQTVAALPAIIDGLRVRGYRFVTLCN